MAASDAIRSPAPHQFKHRTRAFLPFPTKLVAAAIRDVNAERAAVVFYGLSLLTISLLFSAL